MIRRNCRDPLGVAIVGDVFGLTHHAYGRHLISSQRTDHVPRPNPHLPPTNQRLESLVRPGRNPGVDQGPVQGFSPVPHQVLTRETRHGPAATAEYREWRPTWRSSKHYPGPHGSLSLLPRMWDQLAERVERPGRRESVENRTDRGNSSEGLISKTFQDVSCARCLSIARTHRDRLPAHLSDLRCNFGRARPGTLDRIAQGIE
jgi:hypothetical protein